MWELVPFSHFAIVHNSWVCQDLQGIEYWRKLFLHTPSFLSFLFHVTFTTSFRVRKRSCKDLSPHQASLGDDARRTHTQLPHHRPITISQDFHTYACKIQFIQELNPADHANLRLFRVVVARVIRSNFLLEGVESDQFLKLLEASCPVPAVARFSCDLKDLRYVPIKIV